MDRLVTKEAVREDLSLLEKLVAYFSPDDEYKAAMIQNQRVQTQLLSQMAGIDMDTQLDPTNVDMEDLPSGLVGTAESSIASGDMGRAVFDIGGSKYEARVTASGDVNENETVVIQEDGNTVRPADNATSALSLMVGSGEAGRNAVMSPDSVGVHETAEMDEANATGSIVLDPGDETTIVSTGDNNRAGYLLGAGAYNGDDVEYGLEIDGEYIVGGWMSSPFGSVNDSFWFPERMGGAIAFSESVNYKVRYNEDASDQVELTSRLHVQYL